MKACPGRTRLLDCQRMGHGMMEKATYTAEESIGSMMRVLDNATREEISDEFPRLNGTGIPCIWASTEDNSFLATEFCLC
ncbi:hypothetical protein F4861DRAFT_221349 [Xylaria intraflava]|nr:hypothetical protein F4861DRAFT_221349 [Xylaria intraflava]